MAGGARAVVRVQGVRSARGGLAWPRALRLAPRQDMALHDGLDIKGEERADDVHVCALLAAGLLRFVDGRGAVGNMQMWTAQVSIGRLQPAELIVGLDRASTNDGHPR